MPEQLSITNYHRKVLKIVGEFKDFLQNYQDWNVYNQNMKKNKLITYITEVEEIKIAEDAAFEKEVWLEEQKEDFRNIDLEHIILTNDIALRHWKGVFKIPSTDDLIKFWKDLRKDIEKRELERLRGAKREADKNGA